MKFRLLQGRHMDATGKLYIAGHPGRDVIDTETDLCAKFNPPPTAPNFPRKFERVDQFADAAMAGYNTIHLDSHRQQGETRQQFAERMAQIARMAEEAALEEATQPDHVAMPPPAVPGIATAVAREQPPVDDLDRMTVQQLQELASEEEIDLKGARTKPDIVRAIRSSLQKV